jgi:hypothetical protein
MSISLLPQRTVLSMQPGLCCDRATVERPFLGLLCAVQVHETWLGEWIYSDPRKENGTASTAIGILINGNDHYVTNTIVFSSHIGVYINGAADVLTGVHTWNLATGNGGTGIVVGGSQNRLQECYLDWNDLVIMDAEVVTFTDAFLLGGGKIRFESKQSNKVSERDNRATVFAV